MLDIEYFFIIMARINYSAKPFLTIKLDFKANPGFTMIEMLVSLSIIFLLAGAFLANYHYGTQRGNLDMAAQKLASDINLVKSYSLGLKEHTNSNGTAFPKGGWGIRFIPSAEPSYIIFADVNENYFLRSGEENLEKLTDIGLSQKNIAINNINIYCPNLVADRSYFYVVFIPPAPRIVITASQNTNNLQPPTGPGNDCSRLEIILKATATNEEKTITINKYGLIDID